MTITVTQNYYFAGAQFRDIHPQASVAKKDPPNFGERAVTNAGPEIRAARVEQGLCAPKGIKNNHYKLWLLSALSIIGLLAGISLAISGAGSLNPAMTQLGTLIITTFSGIGVKIIDNLLKD